jgi:transcriptional regulator with XRE-family HTH domain
MKSLDGARAATLATDRAPFEAGPGDLPASTPAMGRGRRFARPSDVDRHVGARVRMRRIVLGLTQHQLAKLIRVTYQQQHKYEQGINRTSAGRLFAIARALGVSVDCFFVGLDEPASDQHDLTLELTHAVSEISEKRHQEVICLLARVLADETVARRPRSRGRGVSLP